MGDAREAMVLGAFVGDAMALGPHWVYNTRVIDKKFGALDRYVDPVASFHSGKKAGDFTHYGDQMMVLLEAIAEAGAFDPYRFALRWRTFFQSYDGYFDKATKDTLAAMDDGGDLLGSGSKSDDLAGAARIAPIVYALCSDSAALEHAVRAQTQLSHNNAMVLDCAAFFASLAADAINGTPPSQSIRAALDSGRFDSETIELIRDGVDSRDRDTRDTIAAFGQACSVEVALPGSVHLICAYEADFKQAMVANVMAGGDSAARGMLVGMVLGAHGGLEAIPESWANEMTQAARIRDLLARIG